MGKLGKIRNKEVLNTYFEIMKVCGCGVCAPIGICACQSTQAKAAIANYPVSTEAEYRTDYGNHT